MLGRVERYKIGSLNVDAVSVIVASPDGDLSLYPKTHALLVELIRAAPDVCPSRSLMDTLWSDEFVGDQNLKQRVYQLRSQLGPYGIEIGTVRGVGYRLMTAVESIHDDWMPTTVHDAQADRMMIRATAMVDAMEHGKAVLLLEDVLAREPGWVEPRTLLAWSLMWVGRQAEAGRELRSALQLSERQGGQDRLIARAMISSFSGDAVGAVEGYELARATSADDYWLAVNLMGLYWLLGRDGSAERLLDEIERTRPGFYLNAWQRAFHELCAIGDIEAASSHFAEVIRRNPDLRLPLAAMAPALMAWNDGELEAALNLMDALVFGEIDSMPSIGKDQALTLRSRLLCDLGDFDAGYSDQRQAAALHDDMSSWRAFHDLEISLLLLDDSPDDGIDLLRRLRSSVSALYRVQAHGWLGIHAARHGDLALAAEELYAIGAVEYDGGWEWGYPTRPAFDRAQAVFPMIIGGHVAMARGDYSGAARAFRRARRAAPVRFSVVPVISLDGRAHVEATEGSTLAHTALGNDAVSSSSDRWLLAHRLECVILAQAGSRYRRRAVERSRQSAGRSSATPIEKSSPALLPE
ncbi:MAG: hypothetical protein BMS9Abin12_2308 [Acidimicrobiia bacterium]|nr:MAG: hypothetical protein BMS9Abin12_2308 [Acidimicrobiia bacterium]